MSRYAFSEDEMRAYLLEHRRIMASGCWEYTGSILSTGYGRVWWKRTPWFVHRLAWYLFKGPILNGQLILHRCDNPPCFNFEKDLYIGTTQDNVRDRGQRGRTASGDRQGSAKLNIEKVRLIRGLYDRGARQTELAARFGVGQPAISAIVLQKVWRVE